MSDNVRVIDKVTDAHGREVPVGTDHDGVSVAGYTFAGDALDKLLHLVNAAAWEAEKHAEDQRQAALD